MTDLPYYERPVLLDREKHRTRRVKRSGSFGFARHANSVAVAGVEFNEAMKEYPIVFSRAANGDVLPLLMLGLRTRENLFVGAGGGWQGAYVPAFVRRYPFVLAQLGNGTLGVCIDEADRGADDAAGEALFDEDGKNTAFLQGAVEFLTQWQREFQRTEAFCRKLVALGLLREFNAKADLRDGRSYTINGLLVVDEAKLLQLPDADALALFRTGELNLVTMHLASLSNMNRLVERLAALPVESRPPPRPAG